MQNHNMVRPTRGAARPLLRISIQVLQSLVQVKQKRRRMRRARRWSKGRVGKDKLAHCFALVW